MMLAELFVLGGIFNPMNAVGTHVTTTAMPPDDRLDESSEPGLLEVATGYPHGEPGVHPRWLHAIRATSLFTVAKLYVFDYAAQFDARSVFMATGAKGDSYEPATRFYGQLGRPRDRLVLTENNYVDRLELDEPTTRAVDGIDAFFPGHTWRAAGRARLSLDDLTSAAGAPAPTETR